MQTRKLLPVAISACVALMLAACGNSTDNASKELDSLRGLVSQQQAQLQSDEDFTDAINFSMDSIVAAEGMIMKTNEGGTPSRQKIKQNIEAYKTILQNYREKLNKLQQNLKSQNGAHAAKMQEIIEKMQAQIDAKEAEIAELKKQLEDKNVSIAQLNSQVENLGKNVSDLTEQNNAQQQTIVSQTDKMNEAYYIIGTTKELKAKGLLTGGFLAKKKLNLSGSNLSTFTKIDMRTKKSFTIPSAKPQIMTQAPSGSYSLTTNADKTSTLTILDASKFWSMSNVLVIRY